MCRAACISKIAAASITLSSFTLRTVHAGLLLSAKWTSLTLIVDCARDPSRSSLNACANSIIVEVSFAAKMRSVRRELRTDGGNREKEDSSDPIRHWADRGVDRSADARKASH